MAVSIYEWFYDIHADEIGQELKDRAGRNRLGNRVTQWLRTNPHTAHEPAPDDLQTYIDIYGEQVTVDAVADIEKYFHQLGSVRNALGYLPTGIPPLAARSSGIRPSNTAISVIGEGLAGWHLQRRRDFQLLSRPVGEGPDLVFRDTELTTPRIVFVEVKATQQVNVKQQIKEAAIQLLQYARNATASGNSFSCIIVGVIIRTHEDFELYNLEIRSL